MSIPLFLFIVIVVSFISGWAFAKICPEDDPINDKKEPPTVVRK